MVLVNQLSITRGRRIKVEGIEAGFEAGDLYTALGYRLRDPHVTRVHKATGDSITPNWSYGVVPGSYEANSFLVRIFAEPAHTELAAGQDLNANLGDESLNFTCHVD